MPQDDMVPSDLINIYGRRKSLQDTSSACDIEEVSKGRIVGYKSGDVGPTGPVTESSILLEHLKEMNRVLDRNNNLLEQIGSYLSLNLESITESWFETKATTTSVTPDELDTPDNQILSQDQTTIDITPGYNFINVNNQLHGKNAKKLYIVNDGPRNMYLRTSIDGRSFSPEFQMINGEKRIVANVYEVRYRSSTPVSLTPVIEGGPGPGNTLRASEREIFTPYVTIVNNTSTNNTNNTIPGVSNLSNFIAKSQTITLPNISTQLSSTTIPNGFAVTIRNNKNNTVDMFVSRTDAMSSADRIVLGVGDSMSLFITNTNLIFVAFSLAGQIVDILSEQN
jgi:hypothetical protein